nr:MAG TPA: hypothetical protein [Caudoviricetes sp.]
MCSPRHEVVMIENNFTRLIMSIYPSYTSGK